MKRDGAKAHFKKGPGEWTARLSDGTRMWWSDGRSYALRLEMATSAGLHGLALWRLGSADPLFAYHAGVAARIDIEDTIRLHAEIAGAQLFKRSKTFRRFVHVESETAAGQNFAHDAAHRAGIVNDQNL